MTAVTESALAPAGRVDHQQQLHQVVLRRRHQRLDDEDVLLAAVGQQLHLQAVVAEPQVSDADSGCPSSEQIFSARGRCALPEKTTI